MFNYVIDFFYYYFILWWLWSSWHWNGSLLHKRLRRKAADQILQCYVFPMFFNSIDHLDIHSALVPACDSFIAYFWEAFVTLDRDYADEAATRILEWFKRVGVNKEWRWLTCWQDVPLHCHFSSGLPMKGLHLLNSELVSQPTQRCKLFSTPTHLLQQKKGWFL